MISFVILTMFVGLGSLFLITDQANAQFVCTIGIEKVADPADDTPFDFTAPGSNNPIFTLMDPGNDTDFVGLISNQMVNVKEGIPAGWSLDDIVCDNPVGVTISDIPNGKSFLCTTSSLGAANCTFFNSKRCSIEIVKVADPADDTPFDFTVSGDKTDVFTLMDPSNDTDPIGLDIDNTVDVTEDVPEGWSLDEVECTESQGILINEIPNGITITCETTDEVTCTFTNVRADAVPTLSEWGLIAMAGILGIVGFMVIKRRKAMKSLLALLVP